MIKCWLMKRRIYDLLEGSLAENEKSRVKRHLGACAACRKIFEEAAFLCEAAKVKQAPVPSEKFWHDFSIGLDKKIDDLAPSCAESKRFTTLVFKPALAYAGAMAFVLLLFISAYLHHFNAIKESDSALISEINMLDDFNYESGVPISGIDDDFLAIEDAQNPS